MRSESESALAQTIEFSISEAETLYAASNQSGITLSLLGAPYHPYNSSAAAARAEVLGQALLRSSTPSAFTGQSFADAFTQSFHTQNGPLQSVYGGFTIAAGSLLAANAANKSQAFGQMMLQVRPANSCTHAELTYVSLSQHLHHTVVVFCMKLLHQCCLCEACCLVLPHAQRHPYMPS